MNACCVHLGACSPSMNIFIDRVGSVLVAPRQAAASTLDRNCPKRIDHMDASCIGQVLWWNSVGRFGTVAAPGSHSTYSNVTCHCRPHSPCVVQLGTASHGALQLGAGISASITLLPCLLPDALWRYASMSGKRSSFASLPQTGQYCDR
jgi:hypothetical protein